MTPDLSPLRRFLAGQPLKAELTAENLNQPIEALERLRNDVMANRPPPRIGDGRVIQIRIGIVDDEGPNGEEDDEDTSRYWVTIQRPDETLHSGDVLTTVDEQTPGSGGVVSATNLAEDEDRHGLPTSGTQIVILYQVQYDGGSPATHWFFYCPVITLTGAIRSIKLTDTHDCGGVYKAQIMMPTAVDVPLTLGSSLVEEDIGTPDETEVWAVNLIEYGRTDHAIDPATQADLRYHLCSFIGFAMNGTNEVNLYAFQARGTKPCASSLA